MTAETTAGKPLTLNDLPMPEHRDTAWRILRDHGRLVELDNGFAATRTDIIEAVKKNPKVFSSKEAIGLCFLFIQAGLDTVTDALGFGLERLARNPGRRQEIVDDPSIIPAAIEELVRLDPPAPFVPRVTTRETVLDGQPVSWLPPRTARDADRVRGVAPAHPGLPDCRRDHAAGQVAARHDWPRVSRSRDREVAGGAVKVSIDRGTCTGHGLCYMSAPQLFRDDDEGYGQVAGDGEITAGQEDDARHAAASCPEHAITTSR